MNLDERLEELLREVRKALILQQEIPIYRPEVVLNPSTARFEVVSQNSIGKFSRKNTFQLARIVSLLDVCNKRLKANNKINKRAIYYDLLKLYKDSYVRLDEDLRLVCFNLGVGRKQLNVMSSSKCLLFGKAAGYQEGSLISYDSLNYAQIYNEAKGQIVQVQAQFVLIVEKESVAQVIIASSAWKQLNGLIITAKGYPDYNAKSIVTRLENKLPIYYLGDLDPFGVDIYLQYTFSSKKSVMQGFGNLNVQWINLYDYICERPEHFPNIQSQVHPYSKEDRTKSKSLLQLEIWNIQLQTLRPKIARLRSLIEVMTQNRKKIQLEGVFKCFAGEHVELIRRTVKEGYVI